MGSNSHFVEKQMAVASYTHLSRPNRKYLLAPFIKFENKPSNIWHRSNRCSEAAGVFWDDPSATMRGGLLEEELSWTPLYLTHLALRGLTPTSEDVERLTDYLQRQTLLYQRSDPDQMFVATDYPGYLSSNVGDDTVFVPAHLAAVFPRQGTLETVTTIATQIALCDDNPICISGSTAFLGRIGAIGDLDFCEYHLDTPTILPAKAVTKSQFQPPIPLIQIKCANQSFTSPWDNLEQVVTSALFEEPEQLPANRMKLDFISDSALGLMPTTSMILPLSDDVETGNAIYSHAFQEAVIGRSGPHRALHNAASLGKYLAWLIKNADDLISGKIEKPKAARAPKALKRLLSFLLLIGEIELVEEVLSGLEGEAISAIVAFGRHNELQAMLKLTDDAHKGWVADRINALSASAESLGDEHDAAVDAAMEIAELVLAEINLLLKNVGGSA
jgi:hypothetical protein